MSNQNKKNLITSLFISLIVLLLIIFSSIYSNLKNNHFYLSVSIKINDTVISAGKKSFSNKIKKMDYIDGIYSLTNSWLKEIFIKINPDKINEFESLDIVIGDKIFNFTKKEIINTWEKTGNNTYKAPRIVSSSKSNFIIFKDVINWPGDSKVINFFLDIAFNRVLIVFFLYLLIKNIIFLAPGKIKVEEFESFTKGINKEESVLLNQVYIKEKDYYMLLENIKIFLYFKICFIITKNKTNDILNANNPVSSGLNKININKISIKIFFFIIISIFAWFNIFYLRGIWSDDWASLWNYFQSENLNDFLIPGRNLGKELESIITFLFYQLFNVFKYDTLLIWNIIKYVFFLSNSILIYFILKKINKNSILPELAAVLYLVSPVVNNLWFVVFFYHFDLFFYLLSILLCIDAVKKNNLIYYFLSIILSCFSMFAFGAFIFFDILRPLLFFYIFLKIKNINLSESIKKAIIYWLPYLIIGVVLILYFIFSPKQGDFANEYKVKDFSFNLVFDVLNRYLQSFKYLFIDIFNISINTFLKTKPDLLTLVAFLSSTLSVLFIKLLIENNKNNNTKIKEFKILLLSSILIILVGIFPYALAREPIAFGVGSRHGIFANIGVCLLFSSLFLFLFNVRILNRRALYLILFFYVFVVVNQNLTNIKIYNDDWKDQINFYQQLTWRIPDLKDNTYIKADLDVKNYSYINFRHFFDYSSAINLLYTKKTHTKEINNHYSENLIDVFDSFEPKVFRNYLKSQPDVEEIRNKKIEIVCFGRKVICRPGNLIIASYKDDCLEVNEEINLFIDNNKINNNFFKYEKYINTTQIITKYDSNQKFPLRWIIGKENKNNWQYYYQKAKLCLDNNNYDAIIKLYNEMEEKKLSDKIPDNKLFPFLIGFSIDGDNNRENIIMKRWVSYYKYNNKKAIEIIDFFKDKLGDSNYKIIIQEFNK